MASKLLARYYCPNNETHRVMPYDKFECLTMAPEPGKKGVAILLSTWNAGRTETKRGYCWACQQWVDAHKRTQYQVILDYLKREGVKFKVPSQKENEILNALERKANRAYR